MKEITSDQITGFIIGETYLISFTVYGIFGLWWSIKEILRRRKNK